MRANMAANDATIAAQMLALNVDVSTVLIESTQLTAWMVQITVRDNNGLTFSWMMTPENAREIGKHIRDQGSEAALKILPAPKRILS
jgi:hypothetical protein